MALNRNALFVGGIKPHNYCLPILKRETHRKALIKAATSGNRKFFLGTDTAPHLTKDKESECGCAGVFNATYCVPILAQLFDNKNALSQLENFISKHGALHYNLNINKEKLKLVRSSEKLIFKKFININKEKIKILSLISQFFGELFNHLLYSINTYSLSHINQKLYYSRLLIHKLYNV